MIDPVPSGREVIERVAAATGDWQLQRRDGHYEIICSGVFLMASYNGGSERALAARALERVPGAGLCVLVGGLGVGYTAQAVLADARVGRLDIVEIEPLVIDWHRRYFAPRCGAPLDDRRTTLIVADLFTVPLAAATYDAILLDTDNGPDWLMREANARLYGNATTARLMGALRRGGVLAVWSPDGIAVMGRG